ncbi:MAG: type II toxin-antitoxin system VapC family toxin [Actinomycetota bacterium]|nr:type II toxin-antitoxin system VapC family toxin [Actinomycetota bacterium]
MTPVVIDASAGVELVADTVRGRALRELLPGDTVPWVPEIFYAECGTVLRRWDLNKILTSAQIKSALDDLSAWPLRVTQIRSLFADAWKLRANLTFPDALYVALAEHLGAAVLTGDQKLANVPNLPVQALFLPPSP